MKKFIYFLLSLIVFITLAGNFFTSEYANTDYYKPTRFLIIHSKNPLKVYTQLNDCYLNTNNGQLYDIQKNTIKIMAFQRDLKTGYHCFKISINRNIGYIFITNDPAVDAIKTGGETPLF